ncbi:MAG: fructosamine kinase family protein [Armatimonadetes bacterium]|nr:fructosamine kinase family protein [Armatimonadota bacterium]
MNLPIAVHDELAAQLGGPLQATPLTGGEVNHAALVAGGSERLVVKWKPDAPPGLFDAEADGLRRLRATGVIRVPEVIAWDDAADPPWLALEYIPTGQPRDPYQFARRFAEALAALHRDNSAPDGRFGLDRDNYLGSQPQRNTPTENWADFYRDHRLRPQIERARGLGWLPPERERLLDAVTEQMGRLMEGFVPRPVLIHGDLWSGNFLAAGNEPVLIDPAVYYAEREVEMAYTELFGGFPPGFHAAYQTAYPLDDGYVRRRPLHTLYPLLIHVNHFGETYGPALDRACRLALSA